MNDNNTTRARESGFTLIELMVVVGIVGILAAVAIPAYQPYLVRARSVEGFMLAESAQRAVAEHYDRWGRMPADNAAAGLPRPEALRGTSVASVTVADGSVMVRFGNDKRLPAQMHGKGFSLLPAINIDYPTGPLVWVCAKAKLPAGFELLGEPGAEPLADNFLPAVCR